MATNQRILKFRGKKIDNGEWVCGDLLHYAMGQIVIRKIGGKFTELKVVPETVGQNTGLLDKNKKEIFCGDILKFNFARKGEKSSVEWNNESCTYVLEPVHTTLSWMNEESSLEVIGDIYTTPDLLAK